MLGVCLRAETLRTVSAKHGRQRAAWQPHDRASTAALQAASGEVEFPVDAGKVHTIEAGWKDLKIAVLPKRPLAEPATAEQWDEQRLPEGTARLAWGVVAPSKRSRRRWRRGLLRAGVKQMAEVHMLADGAERIWRSADRVWTGSLQTLDIYHALGQVAQAAGVLYGEGSEAAEWLRRRGRNALLREGWSGLCRLVGEE